MHLVVFLEHFARQLRLLSPHLAHLGLHIPYHSGLPLQIGLQLDHLAVDQRGGFLPDPDILDILQDLRQLGLLRAGLVLSEKPGQGLAIVHGDLVELQVYVRQSGPLLGRLDQHQGHCILQIVTAQIDRLYADVLPEGLGQQDSAAIPYVVVCDVQSL